MSQLALVVVLLGVVSGLAGCKGGGGAFGLLDGTSLSETSFSSSSSSDSQDDSQTQLVSLDLGLTDSDPNGSGGGSGSGTGSGEGQNGPSGEDLNVGTITNPEPGSMALFAGGLALVAFRRRSRKNA
jgi:hypothetical protein